MHFVAYDDHNGVTCSLVIPNSKLCFAALASKKKATSNPWRHPWHWCSTLLANYYLLYCAPKESYYVINEPTVLLYSLRIRILHHSWNVPEGLTVNPVRSERTDVW
jgi:hypothetical protein